MSLSGAQDSRADHVTALPHWKRYFYRILAAEISAVTRYFSSLVQCAPVGSDDGALLTLVKSSCAKLAGSPEGIGDGRANAGDRIAVLLNGTLNYHRDVVTLLREIRNELGRGDRLILVLYNPYYRWLYRFAAFLGLKRGEPPFTFLTNVNLANLCRLSDFEIVRQRTVTLLPFWLPLLSDFVNQFLPTIPFIRALGLMNVVVLRPARGDEDLRPSLSIVIPARNERGNIAKAIERLPDLGTDLEVVFVEGHSEDGTWDEIQDAVQRYAGPWKLRALRQEGTGKNDAVRLGFSVATSDLLTILDADLTVPPERLRDFYEAYCKGLGDFINGTRLVYPQERGAMRFLNQLGNIFFAKAVGVVLETPVSDTLCGTKLFSRKDYERFVAWRSDFGDFDPFGDFELLFPAAALGLGIVDVPVVYLARSYGTTNIHRFRDGLRLLRMVLVGLFRIRMRKVR